MTTELQTTDFYPTTTKTKLTKTTKTFKIQFIKTAIKEGHFDRTETAQYLGIKDRQMRRYLNEIAKQDADVTPDGTHILRALCLNNLTKKAALGKLSTTSEVAIVLAGESKHIEVNENITETVTKTYNMNYSEEDKNAVLEAYRRIDKNRSRPIEPQSLH